MIINEDIFCTTDLGLAASLTASGFPLLDINKSNTRRVVFCFANTKRLAGAIDAYWSDELLISAKVVMEHIKQLKTRIYS